MAARELSGLPDTSPSLQNERTLLVRFQSPRHKTYVRHSKFLRTSTWYQETTDHLLDRKIIFWAGDRGRGVSGLLDSQRVVRVSHVESGLSKVLVRYRHHCWVLTVLKWASYHSTWETYPSCRRWFDGSTSVQEQECTRSWGREGCLGVRIELPPQSPQEMVLYCVR